MQKKMLGLIVLIIGLMCLISLHNDLVNHVYTWRLINMVTAPINIFFGVVLITQRKNKKSKRKVR